MELLPFCLVLAAAVLHATWNALVKTGGDPFVRLALTNAICAVCVLPALAFVNVPTSEGWLFLLGSVVIHHAYYILLALSYRAGDLSQVYPIARGVAPPMVAAAAFFFADESLSLAGIVAIIVICGGIWSLGFARGNPRREGPAVVFALGSGVAIAGYTVLDGMGGRASGDVFGYITWLFLLDALPFCALVAYLRRGSLGPSLAEHWRAAGAGGVLACAGYAMVIWAMSVTPMAFVSALRETSVIMAALIGTLLLKESFGARRIKAAAAVAVGVLILQISRA